ncbi:unnamed protein product, partial [Mesorhabditis spiculigera]
MVATVAFPSYRQTRDGGYQVNPNGLAYFRLFYNEILDLLFRDRNKLVGYIMAFSSMLGPNTEKFAERLRVASSLNCFKMVSQMLHTLLITEEGTLLVDSWLENVSPELHAAAHGTGIDPQAPWVQVFVKFFMREDDPKFLMRIVASFHVLAIIDKRYLVVGLHGAATIGDEDDRRKLLLGAHLIVITPQLLINMLKSVRRAERIYLCDLTMVMLDECHHTTKESAYNVLMDMVHQYKHTKPQLCANAMLIDEVMPSCYALDYLKRATGEQNENRHLFFDEFWSNGNDQALRAACEQERLEQKEIVRELESRIREQLARLPGSRILIFVKERSAAQLLSMAINEHAFFRTLRNNVRGKIAGFATGAGSKKKGQQASQTVQEQARTMEDFKDGKLKVMVATSVMEEGVDVQACNLIIKYNMTGTTISEVQKRGRARAAGSKSVLLVVSDSVEQREMENRQGEMMMAQALKIITQLNEAEFMARSIGETALVLGSALCGRIANEGESDAACKAVLGTVIKYADTYHVQLSLNSLKIIDDATEECVENMTKKKWGSIKTQLFYIPEITEGDLKRMLHSVPDRLTREFLAAEAQIKEEAMNQIERKRRRRIKDQEPLNEWYADDDDFEDEA